MKKIILSLTGMSDDPVADFDQKTPLSIASIPTIHRWASRGEVVGTRAIADTNREQIPLSVLFPEWKWQGLSHSMLQAKLKRISQHKTHAAFRFVTVFNNSVIDASVHLTQQESEELIKLLNQTFRSDGVFFQSFDSRTGIVSLNHDFSTYMESLQTAPTPETIVADAQSESSFFTKHKASKNLSEILLKAREVLENSDINKIKIDLQENPANGLVFWGFSNDTTELPSSSARPKVKLITDDSLLITLVKGLSIPASHIELTATEPSTLQKVGQCLKEDLLQYETVLVWIRAAEFASYAGDFRQKVRWLECFDQYVCKEVSLKTSQIICTPSYTVSSTKKRVTIDPVPTIVLKEVANQSSKLNHDVVFNEESFRRSAPLTNLIDII